MSDDILFDLVDGVALISFNRPEEMNTFSNGMMTGLGDAYRRCDEDDAIRAVVVTGRGKAFCAGAELQGGGDTFNTSGEMSFSSCPLSFQAWDLRKPVIAACNGHAVGVGLGIATQCDMRVFAAEGKYGFLQGRRGSVADFASAYILPKLIGIERAFEMLVGGVRISGETARQWGLASRVVAADQVLEAAMVLARDMAVNCSPLVMGLHKKLLWQGQEKSLQQYMQLETAALHHSLRGPDAAEGGMAFFERRAPDWQSSVTRDWPEFLSE
jgi:enoyl-CoA hydratase/carnithine racemase